MKLIVSKIKKNNKPNRTSSTKRQGSYWLFLCFGLLFLLPGAWLWWEVLRGFQFSWSGLLDRLFMLLLGLFVMGIGVWIIAHRNLTKRDGLRDDFQAPDCSDDGHRKHAAKQRLRRILFILGLLFIVVVAWRVGGW